MHITGWLNLHETNDQTCTIELMVSKKKKKMAAGWKSVPGFSINFFSFSQLNVYDPHSQYPKCYKTNTCRLFHIMIYYEQFSLIIYHLTMVIVAVALLSLYFYILNRNLFLRLLGPISYFIILIIQSIRPIIIHHVHTAMCVRTWHQTVLAIKLLTVTVGCNNKKKRSVYL